MKRYFILFVLSGIFYDINAVPMAFADKSGENKNEALKKKELSLEGIASIVVDSEEVDILMMSEKGVSSGVLNFEGINTSDTPVVSINEDTLRVVSGKHGVKLSFGAAKRSGKISVTLPESYAGKIILTGRASNKSVRGFKLSELNIASSSGDVELNQVAAKKCNISNATGMTDLKKTACSLSMTSTFGNISVRGHNGDLSIENNQGKIEVIQLTGNTHSLTNSMGSISVADSQGKIHAKTSTGGIQISLSEEPTIIMAESSMGTVSVMVPKAIEPVIEVLTSAGKINSTLPVTLVKKISSVSDVKEIGKKSQVLVSTNTGNIDISKN